MGAFSGISGVHRSLEIMLFKGCFHVNEGVGIWCVFLLVCFLYVQ